MWTVETGITFFFNGRTISLTLSEQQIDGGVACWW
jgi:hypothetical protein